MSISNTNPNPLDVVILQRNSTNTLYGETHISGSSLVVYIDSTGSLNADNSSSFYAIFIPPFSYLASSSLFSSQSMSSSYVSGSYGVITNLTSSTISNNNDITLYSSNANIDLSSSTGVVNIFGTSSQALNFITTNPIGYGIGYLNFYTFGFITI